MGQLLRTLLPVACLLAVFLCGGGACRAQPANPLEEADRLAAEADRLWAGSDWAGAEAVLTRALALRQTAAGPFDPGVARLIDRVGRTHYNRHNYDLAADWFREAVEVGERALGPMHLDLADYLGDLGAALRDAGRPEQGEPYVVRSLSIRRTLLGPGAQPVGASLLNLARNYLRQGRISEGRELLAQAAEILERTMGADAPMTRQARNVIAALVRDAPREWLKIVGAVAALVAAGVLVGITVWAETPRTDMPARWIWVGAYLVRMLAIIGFYFASFMAAGFYLGPTALAALNAWGNIPQGLFKLIGLVGVIAAFVALEVVQNAMRWMLGRPFTWTWLPRQPEEGMDADSASTSEEAPCPAGEPMSVAQALRRANLWINAPAFVLMLAGFGGAGVIAQHIDKSFGPNLSLTIGLGILVLLLGVAPAWLWWSVTVPKWRL